MTWPAPEVPCRLAEPGEIPTGARRVLRVAESAGWRVVATYARGTVPMRRPHVVDSLALRMRAGPSRAVAIWLDGRFDTAVMFGDRPPRTCGATQLRAELETRMSIDWDALADIPRDRFGRPMVRPPGGGKPVAYTRCTTYAGSIEDTYNLSRWQQRMVALGLAERPDLMVSVAAHHDDKEELNKVCETAIEAAKGKAAAGVGTALHKLTDRLDRGEALGPVPAEYRTDLTAFEAATKPLKVIALERFVVLDDLMVAGTFDRLYEYQGRLYIGDTKSGSIDYGAGKIAMQMAIYSRGVLYDHRSGTREYLGEVDQNRAIVVHLPAGEGRCELRWIDITAGWEAIQLAGRVRAWRGRRDLYELFDETDAVGVLERELDAEPISLCERVRTATSGPELEALWSEHRDEWTDELTTLARGRKTQLHQQSLKDFTASTAGN
jgi:hypothetical protein